MTALTGVIQQRRHWLRLLVLIGVPIVLMLLFSHHAWAAPDDPCKPKDEVPNLYCIPPEEAHAGKVLGIFDVVDQNGVPISAYGINVDQGGTLDVISKINAFLIGVGFSLIKVVIGFACWLVEWSLGFGLAKELLEPVSGIAASIKSHVIDNLALESLFLTLVALWAAYLILFKQRSKGWMEICTSLVIASIATVTLANPGSFLIGNADDSGILGKTKQLALVTSTLILEDNCTADKQKVDKDGNKDDNPTSCSGQEKKKTATSVSKPITNGLVDAFIQRPTWVLYTGRPISKACSESYGKATLARYNFNRLVMPRIIDEKLGDSWWDSFTAVFSANFSWHGIKENLKHATGSPWGLLTITDQMQKNVMEDFRDAAKDDAAWKQYVDPADAQVASDCKAKDAMSDDQQVTASMENVLSVWFIALAAIIVVLLVVSVSITFLISQVWMAMEVIRAQPALIAGILPGGGRTAMWNWVSGVFRVVLAIFLSVMFLTFFLVMIISLLETETNEAMTIKFLTIDFVAIAFLAFRKKVTAAAKNISTNFGQKMASKTGGGGGASTFSGSPGGGAQLKSDRATFSKVAGSAGKIWRGGAGGGAGANAKGGAAPGKGGGGGGGGGGGKKKNLKSRVQGAVKLGTTVAAAIGTGGTTAAVQATAKTALKNRLKKSAQKRLEKSRAGRATLGAARTGRYIAKDAPVTKARFKNAVGAAKRDLAANTDSARAQKAQKDAAREARQKKGQHQSDSKRLNRRVKGNHNHKQSLRRTARPAKSARKPRKGGNRGSRR
ncbi:hypothetical protein ACIOEZ_27630 [Streptomyces sp. NPDC087866]|uniref:hypothetical protein n=1 Tax=unclassified Streptomyces TaxID=2593676 RepID=UPI00225902F2|nr:hypothetical protein [Streptomyces sp. NBC_01789]MCX4448384.1 hypothetical protein [Streptomyces sp. NBC_01789]